ncbi:MAG TPA: MBL fold metallo-hydrolase [Noviherbaspirillum sp.]|uniref:MBL fold metallo-hydrolase n=1 Tax=Noviherbaspirillum sp. TaxID=1926288 RepID=UPI002B46FC81|nr:MBL fold metallo-hydrolase [Noviherbaspirillum sp.]HJV83937.1 MBL fold metallo-hydrolase [Noviherbaspirillum sp.]
MNLLESQLSYPFDNTIPASGTVQEVAPGVLWLRAGLPFALDHINQWLLRDTDGWTVVDCGIATDTTRAHWENVFASHLDGLPIVRVIATHCHPDHVGLADWLCARWNVPLWMTTGEYSFARMMSASLPGVDGVAMVPHFQRHGLVDPATVEKLQERKSYYSTLVPSVPASYYRMQDRQVLHIGEHSWRVITGFGHSPEHASLYCDDLKVLISGDMVLPRISTNVSVFAVEPDANPVQQYLESLGKFHDLPADTLVLPSHGKPFRGLHTRINQLIDHHRERLAEVLQACTTPQSAADIVPIMFRRPLDSHQLTFAMGEALAHLHKLWFDGVLQRETGGDGVVRFRMRD